MQKTILSQNHCQIVKPRVVDHTPPETPMYYFEKTSPGKTASDTLSKYKEEIRLSVNTLGFYKLVEVPKALP